MTDLVNKGEAPQEAGVRRLTISEILEVAYALVSKRIWLTILILSTPYVWIFLGTFLISFFAFSAGLESSGLTALARGEVQALPMMLFNNLFLVLSFVAVCCVGMTLILLMIHALIAMYLQIEDGCDATYFSCWGDAFARFGAIMWFYTIFPFIVLFGLLLLIVPGIIWSQNYSLTPVILIAEPDLTVRQAMQRSKHLIYGERMRIWLLNVGFFFCFKSIFVFLNWFIDVEWVRSIGISILSLCFMACMCVLPVVFYLQSRLVKDAQAGLQKN